MKQILLPIASVSGKRPTDDEITLVISEIANHFNSGLSNSLHQEYYITKVRELFQAACASGAVATVAERGFYCYERPMRYVPCKEQCTYCALQKPREAPSGGQP